MSRFDAFTEEEKSTIGIGLAMLIMDSMTGAMSGEACPEPRLTEIVLCVANLMNEIGASFGLPGISEETMKLVKQRAIDKRILQ